jgi:hypothetical protein
MTVTFFAAARSIAARRSPRSTNRGPAEATAKDVALVRMPFTLASMSRPGAYAARPAHVRVPGKIWMAQRCVARLGQSDLLVTFTRNNHAFTTPPTRLATTAGISQYKPPPAFRMKVSPVTPTSTVVIRLGENLSK